MPEWILKGGEKPPKDMVDFLAENRENYLRVNMEVETPKEKLQGAFHALLRAWHKSGEYSHDIKTLGKLKRYYKFVGCDWRVDYFLYKGEEYKDAKKLFTDYPDAEVSDITKMPRHFMDMTKKEICGSLDCMITEINASGCNNKKVLYSLSLITNDIETLNWLKWDKYQENKNINKIVNKFEGEIV